MDWLVVRELNAALVRHDGVEDALALFEHGSLILLALLLAGAFVLSTAPEVRRGAVAAGLSAVVALVATRMVGGLVHRPRPFVTHPDQVHNFLRHVADPGFPSDHATAASAVCVAIALRHRMLGVLLLPPVLVMLAGRVALGAHYPSDIAAGVVLGASVAFLAGLRPVAQRTDRIADAAAGLIHRAGWRVQPSR